MLDRIRANVAAHGHHLTLVRGGRTPRFAYSVGLTDHELPELVLAGATSLSANDVKHVLNEAAAHVRERSSITFAAVDVAGIGTFRPQAIDATWRDALLLGAHDFYGRTVGALQLVPDEPLHTIDVPDMSRAWTATAQPVWQWLCSPWDLDVSPDAVAVTNLSALRGDAITEAARWEDTEWELFAGPGPDTAPEDVRVVPLATLVGHDPSLRTATELKIGTAIRRTPPGPWTPWGRTP